MSSDSNALQCGSDAGGSSTSLLSAILNEIGASEFLQNLIDDDHEDDSIPVLSRLKPDRISSKYGLPQHLASSFVEKCRSSVAQRSVAASISDFPSTSARSAMSSATSSPAPASAAHPVDAASLLRKLNLDMLGELGKGGFGTVYKCKDALQKRFVAVKLVNDAKNAQAAMREGQKLLRAKHKNIVQIHRVLDLSPILGTASCALEMEVVSGGDLSEHLEAARRRPEQRLPAAAVLRFSRQLLQALVYLRDDMKWLHGDIKPQNMLLQCHPLPADGSAIDYSDAEIKLADFGLAKVMDQENSSASFMLSNASTKAGVVKGTMWYLSPEALQGASSGYERTYSDDIWSTCLVIYEMDTGLSLQQLMTAPGAIKLEELLTKTSRALLPLLASVLAVPDAASRCKSAAELLQKLDASVDPLYIWEEHDVTTNKYVAVHPAASVALEEAFSANQPHTMLPLQPPLDLNFDLKALLSSATALGSATERRSGAKRAIRRLLKPSALTSSCDIPAWQQLVDGREWLQCSPAACAKLEIDMKNPSAVPDSKLYRRITLQPGSIGSVQLPLAMKSEPYCEPAQAADMAMLSKRVHDSLPEFDITSMVQVVNPALASKYADYRHRLAARCNGNPNERILFHFPSDFVIPKIWQEGEGHDPRLSVWAEVGKGAYFSEHVMYGYAYKYSLWPSPPKFEVKPEPPIGATMQVFATLVCLGNVADVGPGCETCSSPVWDAWKKEFEYQKSAENRSPKPTRPPAMPLPSDAAERQQLLDLMQVRDVPRYDSVTSTEGDFATHPASTNQNAAGQRMSNVMHPRLKERAAEWSRQYVLFETQNSYPMFIMTLTKTRDSPVGVLQLKKAGCDVPRIKALGFTAVQFKNAGCGVQELKGGGFIFEELMTAGYDLSALIAGGFSVGEMKGAGVTALQLKDAGFGVQELNDECFSLQELMTAGYDLSALIAGGFSVGEMKGSGVTALQLKDAGCGVQEFKKGGFSLQELISAGYDLSALIAGGFSVGLMKSQGVTALQLKDAGFKMQELKGEGFSLQELISAGYDLSALIAGGFSVGAMKRRSVTALQLKDAGCGVQQLKGGGFSLQELISAGYDLSALIAGGFSVKEMKGAGVTALQLKEAGCYSIIAADAHPALLAQAQLYYFDVEFASQLCSEFAAAERGDAELSSRLSQAHDALQLIVDNNLLLRSPPSNLQPSWPRHEALLRFDLPLFVWKQHLLYKKEWASRFVVLRGSCLYYSNGKNGHADSLEGSLAFMQSNPAPDGRYCLDLKGACACRVTAAFCCASQSLVDAGCSVATCSTAVEGQAFAFVIKFPADRPAHKDVRLAAADDVTRQRCVRIVEAASAGASSSSLPNIASSAALTSGLFLLRSVRAVNAVLAVLDRPAVGGLDALSLKTAGFSAAEVEAVGCDPASAQAAGYDTISLVATYGYDAVKTAGCDISHILVSALLCTCTHTHAP
jgi:serine/threonine protein kinase/ribosomal protein L13E